MLQVHLLVFMPDDAIANHLRGPALFRHFIRIQGFRQTCAAVGAMIALEAGTQAGVAVLAVAEAKTWHLIHHAPRFRGGFVTFHPRGGRCTRLCLLPFTPYSPPKLSPCWARTRAWPCG